MRTIAENANDFADLRTTDGGNCIYVDKTIKGYEDDAAWEPSTSL